MSETTPANFTRLSKELRSDFEDFIETINIPELNKILRDLIIAYIRLDPELAEDFFKGDGFKDISMIFHLLDMIEKNSVPLQY